VTAGQTIAHGGICQLVPGATRFDDRRLR